MIAQIPTAPGDYAGETYVPIEAYRRLQQCYAKSRESNVTHIHNAANAEWSAIELHRECVVWRIVLVAAILYAVLASRGWGG